MRVVQEVAIGQFIWVRILDKMWLQADVSRWLGLGFVLFFFLKFYFFIDVFVYLFLLSFSPWIIFNSIYLFYVYKYVFLFRVVSTVISLCWHWEGGSPGKYPQISAQHKCFLMSLASHVYQKQEQKKSAWKKQVIWIPFIWCKDQKKKREQFQ